MQIPAFTFDSDLTKAAYTFGRMSKFQEFCRLTKFLSTVYSAELELVRCLDNIELYDKYAAKFAAVDTELFDKTDIPKILFALFGQALSLYCRATDASTKIERKSVPIVDHFDDTFKKRHKKIREVRDKAFAHYDKSETSLEWNEQNLYVHIEPHQQSIRHSSKTKFYDHFATAELKTLSLEALRIVNAIRVENDNALNEEMIKNQDNPAFYQEINKNGGEVGSFQLRDQDSEPIDTAAAKKRYLDNGNST